MELEEFTERVKAGVAALWETHKWVPFHYVMHLPDGSTKQTVLMNGYTDQTAALVKADVRSEGASYVAIVYEADAVLHPEEGMSNHQVDNMIRSYGGVDNHPWRIHSVIMNVQTRDRFQFSLLWAVNQETLSEPELVEERPADGEHINVFPTE